LPEFKRTVLEVMRQPLEERRVTISRAKVSIDFPANFMLIASMNPCPCGYYNHPDKECVCGPGVVQKYLNKVFCESKKKVLTTGHQVQHPIIGYCKPAKYRRARAITNGRLSTFGSLADLA
jgi:hypothetical protein